MAEASCISASCTSNLEVLSLLILKSNQKFHFCSTLWTISKRRFHRVSESKKLIVINAEGKEETHFRPEFLPTLTLPLLSHSTMLAFMFFLTPLHKMMVLPRILLSATHMDHPSLFSLRFSQILLYQWDLGSNSAPFHH